MLRPNDLSYHIVRSIDLRPSDHEVINQLLAESVALDFPGLNSQELAFFVAHSAAFRRDPNLAVGGSTIRKHQSYARAVHILGVKNSEIVASLPMADNASARQPQRLPERIGQVVAAGQRVTKLYVPWAPVGEGLAIEHRYRWSGLLGARSEVRDNIMETLPGDLHIGHSMLMAGYNGHYADQPASAWPYMGKYELGEGEEAWLRTLVSSNFHPIGEPEPVRPFGTEREVTQTAMRIDSLRDFRAEVSQLAGATAVRNQFIYHLPEAA